MSYNLLYSQDSTEPDMGQTDQDLLLKLPPEKPKTKATTVTAMKKSLFIMSMTTEKLTNATLKRTSSPRSLKS